LVQILGRLVAGFGSFDDLLQIEVIGLGHHALTCPASSAEAKSPGSDEDLTVSLT
jgi:hypothetical protein